MIHLLSMSICTLAMGLVSLSIAIIFRSFMECTARNPELAPKAQGLAIIMAALAESMGLLIFVTTILCIQKINTTVLTPVSKTQILKHQNSFGAGSMCLYRAHDAVESQDMIDKTTKHLKSTDIDQHLSQSVNKTVDA